ncbi:hypothetical protein [Streptococcus sobrinus]|uniref:hypothetical protein n=1 Tax=Streptococcus sobrinus TaxID=1310 RepID=UPI000381DB06|nr:hypothetical protein [Streptococcus sobrinus]
MSNLVNFNTLTQWLICDDGFDALAVSPSHANEVAVKFLSWDAFLFLGIPLNSPLDYLTTRQGVGSTVWETVGENLINFVGADYKIDCFTMPILSPFHYSKKPFLLEWPERALREGWMG